MGSGATGIGAAVSERDCIHGQLARSCGLCERDATIAALQAEVERYKGYQNIEAQHDETGRIWSGPRYKMPARYVEISNESGEPPSGETSAPQFRIVSVGQYDSTMECVRCGFKYIESADATHNENLSRSGHLCPPVAAASAQEQKK